MMGNGEVVVVSGASGFLGSRLCQRLSAAGYRVRALVRETRAARLDGVDAHFECSLPGTLDPKAFQHADVFVHCAFDTRFRDRPRAHAVNVEGSKLLFAACRRHRVRQILFISSLSAHEDAISIYGRTKLRVEGLLDPARDLALRPGYIVGAGGIFARTARAIESLPFIPLFYGGRQLIQTVYLDDVCAAIRTGIEEAISGTLGIAEIEPVELRHFYGEIARALGKEPRFVTLPGDTTLAVLRILERAGLRLPLSSDNLAGLKRLRTFDLAEDARRLGVAPLPMAESLKRVPWTRIPRHHEAAR